MGTSGEQVTPVKAGSGESEGQYVDDDTLTL